MTAGQTGVFRLGSERVPDGAPSFEDAAYARLADALAPAEVSKAATAFLEAYPRSRYDTQVRVALAGAEDALKALSSRFVRLSASAFRSTGDPRYLEDIRKAVRGDKDAASRISDMYAQGSNGVATNPQRAEQWLRYSALLGNAIACYTLYRSLADKGDPDAEFFGPEAIRLGYVPPKGLCGSRKWESC
jgi:TPR repeat protein